ncbi:excalibur calcium-binding domain-containing protein [Nocardioides pacificus]
MISRLKYEHKSVKVLRGTDGASKWAADGWEVVGEEKGKIRTTLQLRRARTRAGWLNIVGPVAALVALAAAIGVGAALEDDEPASDDSAQPARESSNESQLADEKSAPPSDEEKWAVNYEESQGAFADEVAAALGVGKVRALTSKVPLGSCALLKKDLPVGARISETAQAISVRRPPTAAQVFDVISAATTYVCPELAKRHATQVSVYTRAARQAELDKQRQAEARERRKARQQAAANPPAPPVDVYYANCTEVENAGAAPIYAGQPGYSRDLDRDGDGVACE